MRALLTHPLLAWLRRGLAVAVLVAAVGWAGAAHAVPALQQCHATAGAKVPACAPPSLGGLWWAWAAVALLILPDVAFDGAELILPGLRLKGRLRAARELPGDGPGADDGDARCAELDELCEQVEQAVREGAGHAAAVDRFLAVHGEELAGLPHERLRRLRVLRAGVATLADGYRP